ncbi:MAG TPA: tetratricopeptide repeat protein [Rhizomicrobium sp.]|jgi:tetratricopeptide (TPR) repeat protein|nr:tetratricopeptide repeat protein [Rhizomicrobium sp.]
MDDTGNPNGPFFLRFNWPDEAQLPREIERASADLGRARAAGDQPNQLKMASVLGNMLTTARQEQSAVDLLEWALPLAYALGDKKEEAGVLLNLATARQYLGQRDQAQILFQQALELAQDQREPELEAFVQHHRGRCYAEQNRIVEARLCFDRALKLRLQVGSDRAKNSQKALDELDGR